MAGDVTDAHRITYRSNVKLALQERRSQFDDHFSYTDQVTGKQVMVVDLIGSSEARQDAPEGGDTPDIANSHEPVWMRPTRLDWGQVIKIEDQIKALTDFKSPYVQSGVNGIVRKKNSVLSAAIFGPRLIGNEVPVSTAWAGKTVAEDVGLVGTPQPMNVKKILRGIRLMEEDDVIIEEEELKLALDPQEIENLWSDLTYISRDYREKAQMDDASRRVTAIFGIPIITTKKIANFDADTSIAALFCKSGMYWGPAMPLTVKSEQNPNKQYREHPYIEMWIAATRTEDAKAVKILNFQP